MVEHTPCGIVFLVLFIMYCVRIMSIRRKESGVHVMY